MLNIYRRRTTLSAIVSALIACDIAWGLLTLSLSFGHKPPPTEPPLFQSFGILICLFFGAMTVPLARGENWARKLCRTIAFFYIADFVIMTPVLNISLLFGVSNFKQELWRGYALLIGLHVLLSVLLWKPFTPVVAPLQKD